MSALKSPRLVPFFTCLLIFLFRLFVRNFCPPFVTLSTQFMSAIWSCLLCYGSFFSYLFLSTLLFLPKCNFCHQYDIICFNPPLFPCNRLNYLPLWTNGSWARTLCNLTLIFLCKFLQHFVFVPFILWKFVNLLSACLLFQYFNWHPCS